MVPMLTERMLNESQGCRRTRATAEAMVCKVGRTACPKWARGKDAHERLARASGGNSCGRKEL